jgi:hypothetical protein
MSANSRSIPLISNNAVGNDDTVAVVTTYQGSLSLRIHAVGFLEIAGIGLRNAVVIDAVLPSILYAIRHATELFLKYVIFELSETHEHGKTCPGGHGLTKLFSDHKAMIEHALEIEAAQTAFHYREWIQEFEAIISEVDGVDPDGQTLRYPIDRKGSANLDGTIHVSLRQVEIFARHAEACFTKFSMRNC